MSNQEKEINDFYGNNVSYFSGDGLYVSSEELGYEQGKTKWKKGDKIEITEYDRETGEYIDYYTIYKIECDEDGQVFASVYYSGSSLEN